MGTSKPPTIVSLSQRGNMASRDLLFRMNDAAAESLVHLAHLVMNLFPRGVVAMQTYAEASSDSLLPAERLSLGRAVDKRVREFAAGRLCARHAIKALAPGMEETPLLPREDRFPRWPDAVVGSITHTEGFCTAVVAARSRFAGLGVDAERVQNVSCELWPQILRREELDRLLQLEVGVRQRTAAIVFCAKEAYYKCQYAVTGAWLDFTDVAVEISADAFRVTVHGHDREIPRGLRSLNGHYLREGNLIVAGVALAADRLRFPAAVQTYVSPLISGRLGQEYR